ncbi:MAG TPA: FAD-dependent oxidoreductase, partial [Ktedonobacterales bacterium]|nr:FAD-dependent oxidoreductase [Ktedonobacterales bacterium]
MSDPQSTRTATTVATSSWSDLRARLRGRLIQPDDADYEEARHTWNGMADKRPAAIAQCADAGDVVAAVNFARDHGVLLAVRGGGHSIPGHSTCDDGLVIDLSPMKAISVDPTARTARAEGGVKWAEFDAATQQHGLATTGGTNSDTGIAGLTLGGGEGWLVRTFGYACDNLIAAEVVLADGSRVRASEQEHADLFWGLRGGGGNFGVVTAFEYRLHPVGPIVLSGPIIYPLDQVR